MIQIGMVCEAPSDHKTAITIAELVLGRVIDTRCLDEAIDNEPKFTRWTKLDRHQKKWPRHHLNGWRGNDKPLHGQTLAARKALWLFFGKAEAVILMVDGDAEGRERLDALERARQDSTMITPDLVIVAVPQPEREAWHIAGFEPVDNHEHDRLKELTKELGSDPRTNSHTLKHGRDNAKRNAKRILDILTDNDHEREQECLSHSSVQTLCERGGKNGLVEFVDGLIRLKSHLDNAH